MAYICKRKNREGNYYVYLCETYRIGNKTKTRNIKSYGQLDKLEENEPGAYERLREEAKAGLLTDQAKKEVEIRLDLNEEISSISKNYGWLLLNDVYEFLEISKVLKNHTKNENFEYDIDKILKLLVYQRILTPVSKSKTIRLQDNMYGEWDATLHDVYRSLDQFSKLKDNIKLQMHNTISGSIGREATLVFYDVTNYYFDTDFNDEDVLDDEGNVVYEALRKRGPSKEKKPKPIVQMGLFMDSNGIPISYELFPGNNTDPITYIPAIEQVKKQYGIKRVVTVADKAMNSAKNVTKTYENGDGWIFSQKVRGSRGVAKEIQEFALETDNWKYNDNLSFAVKSKIRTRKLSTGEYVKEKIVVTWNEKYAKREKVRREGALEYAAKLTNSELYRIASKKGGGRYLEKVVIDKETGKEVKLNPFIKLDIELAQEDAKFDGLSVIVTSEINMSDEEIIGAYRQLHKIEDCFRVTKTELSARPIYVWKDEHIQAHFLTCFISLTILRIIKNKVNNEMSTEKIIKALYNANAYKLPKDIFAIEENEELQQLNELLQIDWDKAYLRYEEIKRYGDGTCNT